MKKKILFLLLIVPTIILAQQKQYNIVWEDSKTLSGNGFSIEVPKFNDDYFNYDLENGLSLVNQWETNIEVNESSATITNAVYQSISKTDLKDLDVNKIPEHLTFNLKNAKARDKKYILLQVSPIIKNSNGGYKKLTAFKLNYKSNSNKSSLITKNNSSKIISNSVLNSGEWYRFYVDTTGVFKLSKNFLERLGVNTSTVDPRTIKLYGHGGSMIPFSNTIDYPIDVPENAIKFIGEEDGVFNNNDYILFYGQGPKGYNEDSNTHINCYTDKTYYYINVSPENGKRIQPFNQPIANANTIIDTYDDYQFHEVDNYNLLSLGRRWFGDKFDIENTKEFEFNFEDLIISEPIRLSVYIAAASSKSSQMNISVNNVGLTTLNLSGVSSPTLASGASYNGNLNVNSSNIKISLEFNNLGNPSTVGYLDFISIEGKRELKFYGNQFLFKSKETISTPGIAQYMISDASNINEVWDITDSYNISNYENQNSNTILSFKAEMGLSKSYVAVTDLDYFAPKSDSKTTVNNQNINGTVFQNSDGVFQDIDYVIISPNIMLNQAERLAGINRNQYGLNVKVLSLEDIYTEFSSGNQDIGAIRNVVKYIYDNASSPESRVKYLCLFGDGSYDYKDRITNNTNIIPSWYSYNSFSLATSFVSDDFYAMMDDHEGTMVASDRLDIATGRILADTPQRANELVDKIESYYKEEAFGSWRNNFLAISDDNDINLRGTLQSTTNTMSDLIALEKPFINVTKIHSDAFQQESSAGGNSYPSATNEIVNTMDKGALVVNYFGHGGEEGLAEERLLLKPDILGFRNFNKLYCFVTVTCEFTRFDNPLRETAGEFTFWNTKTGAIGLITTTRQVFVNFGITLNKELGQYLFSYSDNDTYNDYEYPSIAEALMLTKNHPSISASNQKNLVFFIGDPAMKLAFPKPNIKLTKINDNPIETAKDTLKALSYVKLSGVVTDETGNLLDSYNGKLSTTIYDKLINRQTLVNDRISDDNGVIILDFETLGEIIFRGQATVENGEFEFDFIVPKDIGIPVGLGKISFYSENENLTEDYTGGDVSSIKIGGLNENAPEDNTGPTITLFMNDENFVTGGITNESPTLLVKLEDINGINTASGVGHDIVGILDGDETNPFILNDFYQTEPNDYTKGIVNFQFRDLEPGLHTLTVKAWDVYNNSSISEIQFIVFDEDDDLVINNVLNYPNPFVNYTEFWFNHNSSESLDVSIQIFTVSGKLIRTLNSQTNTETGITSSLSRDVIWDGRDDFGEKIGKGVYIYKLKVHSNTLNKTVEKIEKLVIL